MHLSRSTNLGLQIVLELTRQQAASTKPQRLTAATISEAIAASPTHVAKLTSRLVEIGVISSSRGRTGGIHIAPGGLAYPLGTLIRKLEGDEEKVSRYIHADTSKKEGDELPELTSLLHRAEEDFFDVLDQRTIADILPKDIQPTAAMVEKV